MAAVYAGTLAAVFAIILNRWTVRGLHKVGVALLVPIIEETTKTLLAIEFGANIYLTHLFFGIIEAIHDLVFVKSGLGLLAAGASAISHLAFAGVTAGIWQWTGNLWLAIIAAIGVHVGWNIFALDGLPQLVSAKGKKKEENSP